MSGLNPHGAPPTQDVARAVDAVGVSLLEWSLIAATVPATEFLLVRHGQQGTNDLNDPMRRRGGDASLSDLGRRQRDLVTMALRDEHVDAVYSSTLLRARETAEPIADGHLVDVGVMPDLREIAVFRDVPRGRTARELLGEDGYALLCRTFATTWQWAAFDFSEGSAEFRRRVALAMSEIRSSHPAAQRIVVVSHGGTINAIISSILGTERDMLVYPAHASITRVATADGRWAVRSLNETQHLRSQRADLVTY